MNTVLMSAAQRTLNHYVQESTVAVKLLESLEGQSLAIEVVGLGVTLVLNAEANGLVLTGAAGEPATATVSGSPGMLLGLLRDSSSSGVRASGVVVTGDAQTAEAFSDLLRLARPDLEERLSCLVGDLLAHELAETGRQVSAWGRRAFTTVSRSTSEYLQEESRQLPPRLEAEAFFREVEQLRDDVDRIVQRVDRFLEASFGGSV